jgi:hypothetical protein
VSFGTVSLSLKARNVKLSLYGSKTTRKTAGKEIIGEAMVTMARIE